MPSKEKDVGKVDDESITGKLEEWGTEPIYNVKRGEQKKVGESVAEAHPG